MKQPKVFCIGFQKTGTTSLGIALEMLGRNVCGYWPFRDLADWPIAGLPEELIARAKILTSQHDAFKDTPWPVLYKECDEHCPGSKFIHVVREEESWLRSVINDFGSHPNSIHQAIYGVR